MALTGKQKAAMLLMSLDASTAAELLKGVKPDLAQEVATELAYLDAAGYRSGKQSTQIARQFCSSLQVDEGFGHESFIKEILKSTVGERQAEHIQSQIQDLVRRDDPFTRIRFVDSQTIASVLKKEHPRTAAVVLSGLPEKKSSDVLDFLGEGIRLIILRRMTMCKNMTAQAKAKMAETVCDRLDAVTVGNAGEAVPPRFERFSKKVAVILRNLGRELRDCLLGSSKHKDDKAGRTGVDLMMTWEDIPQIADELLQRALITVDIKKLALALVGADFSLVQKIMSNISEEAAVGLDEEVSRVSAFETKDVEEAREEIIRILHQWTKGIK